MPDRLDTLAALTLATSDAHASHVSAADAADPRCYPFDHTRGRDHEARVLRGWLLGGRDAYDPARRPLGGAALVTGFRGVGKSTLVNKVLFDVSLASLYNLRFVDQASWGPFDRDQLRAAVERAERGAVAAGHPVPRLYVPVHVDVANAIERRDLMERVLRRTYFALSRYQIGALRPDLMRRARLAYIRTLGKLEAGATARVNEKLASTLGATLEGLSKLEVTAQQEMEFAETLKLVADDLSIEEMEDELIDLGAELSDGAHGVVGSAGRRLVDTVAQARNQGYLRLRQLFQGDVGRQVHLVFVFDELDKLDDGTTAPTEATGARSSTLTKTAEVIRQLKILFSTTGVSAVVVGGAVAEERWLDEVAERDPLLRSVFSRHVYVPQLGLKDIKEMFVFDELDPDTPAALAFWTRGRYKQLLRARGAWSAQRLDDEFPHVPHEVLAKILGDFGGTDVKAASRRALDPVAAIKAAPDLEELAAVLLTASPITRREAFGADVLRTLLLRVAVEVLDPMMMSVSPPAERTRKLLERLAEMLPAHLTGDVLDRITALVLAAHRT